MRVRKVLSKFHVGLRRRYEVQGPPNFDLLKLKRQIIETAIYQWSEWSECSPECKRIRTRACPDGYDCKGGIRQRRNCSIERESIGLVCWGEKPNLIPTHLEHCSLQPSALKPDQSFQRIIQG